MRVVYFLILVGAAVALALLLRSFREQERQGRPPIATLRSARFASWRVALLATAFGTLSGCSMIAGIAADALGIPLESKAVALKLRGNELIATDGTYCFVSAGRYADVEVGDHVLCSWSPEDPTTGTSQVRKRR